LVGEESLFPIYNFFECFGNIFPVPGRDFSMYLRVFWWAFSGILKVGFSVNFYGDLFREFGKTWWREAWRFFGRGKDGFF